jgi:hypothetical protein
MKYIKFIGLGLALIFVFTSSFVQKKALYPECKYAVDYVIEEGNGYIKFQSHPSGADITGQVEGVDYSCNAAPFHPTCTITTDCRQVLELFNGEYMIVGWYNKVQGEYQP